MIYTYIKTAIFTLIIFLGIISQSVYSQNSRRDLEAVRTSSPPVIDGSLDEAIWDDANIATDFYQYEPHNDRKASLETKVKVLYDDEAIYIGAILLDNSPDSILTELGHRNSGNNLNSDMFWIDINPFNDGINGFRFQVSASGVQTDMNMSGRTGDHGDSNWDAVWKSEVSINRDGWIVEMKIPYSALRFPKQNVQKWGINFWRDIRRMREVSSWNFVDRRIGNPVASMGVLDGIEGISPPLRLAFFPYISNYLEKYGANKWVNNFNGGMDVKLGISESFTFDMTLIPDFGQVQSDDQILNLSPFEVKYDEKRQFFTEGTDLYNKANLFYSRRIGSLPKGYYDVFEQTEENEIITENPLESRLINAAKISGRTTGGLGIGFFNAITAPAKAIVLDTLTNNEREITTQALTNYNLIVFDQSLKNNSYLSFINTNVNGFPSDYVANITGTDFRIFDKSNMYKISGAAAISQQYFTENDDVFGYKYHVNAGKSGGTWQYNYYRSVLSDSYEQNDLGYLRHNNNIDNHFSLSHNVFKPFGKFRTLTNEISLSTYYLYEPLKFAGLNIGYQLRMLFLSRFFIYFSANYAPLSQKDFFEPRVPGRYFDIGDAMNLYLSFSSDYRKRIYFDGSINFYKVFSEHNQFNLDFFIKPTVRISDQFNLSYSFIYSEKKNNLGYVMHLNEDTIYFGRRYLPTFTNSIASNFIFSNKASLNLNLRHYWSRVYYYDDYYVLNLSGLLERTEDDLSIANINYNAFTVDIIFNWEFAPGSQLSLMWKHAIYSNADEIPLSYMENLNRMFNEPQLNSFSLKILYYLDYQHLKYLSRS